MKDSAMSNFTFIPAAPGFTLSVPGAPQQPILAWAIADDPNEPCVVFPVTLAGVIDAGQVRDPEGNVVLG